MKKIKILFFTTFIALLAIFVSSCYTPSPLYGSWADNNGNKITFSEGGSFNVSIVTNAENNTIVRDEGKYTVNENVLVFNAKSGTIVTEWDLRGSILYLKWTLVVSGKSEVFSLSLYKS